MKVLVIGAGLMGSSVGLALNNAGHQVCLKDNSESVEAAARSFLQLTGEDLLDPEIVVVAVPPSSISQVIIDSNSSFPNATLIDIGSIMVKPQQEVESSLGQISNWIPTHPMAGKELGGYENASHDLFHDRLWVVSPNPNTADSHLARVRQLINDCGAIYVSMDGHKHDEAVAVTSHLPQILATVLAQQLNDLSQEALAVSGQGLRDLTRIASSSGELWNEILISNKENISLAISKTQQVLENMKTAIVNESKTEILQQFELGNSGKAKIPGKHGGLAQEFSQLSIEIDDKPGQLAAIFATAGRANVNIEDVRIDHALGKQIAIIELFVLPKEFESLKAALTQDGWKLRATKSAQ